MANIFRVYTGNDGQSHLEEMNLPLEPFIDTEGAYGEGTPLESATGITFRVAEPGYFLDWHNAPRRLHCNQRQTREKPSGPSGSWG